MKGLIVVLLAAGGACSAAPAPKPLQSGWAEEDVVLTAALALRVPVIEQATGFRFDHGYTPVGRWDYLDLGGGAKSSGRYMIETGDVLFPAVLMSTLSIRYGTPVRLMAPAVMAADESFITTSDHELGHALADQISRRNGLGPWYTPESFEKLPSEQQMGLKVVSEGIGTFFEHRGGLHAGIGVWRFPGRDDDSRFFPFTNMVYDGGEWVVHDALKRHGERGLLWFIANPMSVGDTDRRADAVAYRDRALTELGATR